ncbi:hypothetical protein Tco_0251833 [Tanacetum coccineum]
MAAFKVLETQFQKSSGQHKRARYKQKIRNDAHAERCRYQPYMIKSQRLEGFKEFSSDEQIMTSDHNSSELGIHDHNNELSSSKLVRIVVPPADKTASYHFEQETQSRDSLIYLNTRVQYFYCKWVLNETEGYIKMEMVMPLFQLKTDSLPHAHAQTTKTYYKHQDSRIMKAQELKTKTSAQTLIYKIFLQRYQVYQGRLLASFQDDAKYEHVGQDTRSKVAKTVKTEG